MEILKGIPAKTGIIHKIDRITINLGEKKAYVEVNSSVNPHENVAVDILKIFTDYSSTTTQKNTIKAFFRYLIAEAVDVVENTITEPIFPED